MSLRKHMFLWSWPHQNHYKNNEFRERWDGLITDSKKFSFIIASKKFSQSENHSKTLLFVIFWSLKLYVNAAEAYANQDWKLKIEAERNQKNSLWRKFRNTSKKFSPSPADSWPHKVNHIWSGVHINLKKLYLGEGRTSVEDVSLNLPSPTKCICGHLFNLFDSQSHSFLTWQIIWVDGNLHEGSGQPTKACGVSRNPCLLRNIAYGVTFILNLTSYES